MRKHLIVIATSIAVFVFANTAMAALPAPAKPENGGYVRDDTSTLSTKQIQKLNETIDGYKKRTSNQLAVLMVSTLGNEDYLEQYSLNVARSWGVGESGKNNGVLLLVVKDDRKMRIEVGTGLEGDLTDLRAGRIIRDRIAPLFKAGKYYEGIDSGLQGISLALGDAPDPLLSNDTGVKQTWYSGLEEIIVAIFWGAFFVITWLGAILGRTERWWPGGIIGAAIGGGAGYFLSQGGALFALGAALGLGIIGLVFDYLVSKNYRKAVKRGDAPSWWAGGTTIGGGGFSGGGGFGGFGGGGFSGGGSSGSW